MENKPSTIVSLCTPIGAGAVGIVRMSGADSLLIASKIFKTKSLENFSLALPRTMYFGTLSTSSASDKCLCVYFKAPFSFTGEDIVEFQCHGGQIILQSIIKECVSLGARLSLNGEFSKRAFLNGKMDLSSVEGMADMINAESEASSKLAFSLFDGGLSSKIKALQEKLEIVIAYIEAGFDYPEDEEVPPLNVPEVTDNLNYQIFELKQLISSYSSGSAITQGISVAILGKPNVGKSSILNSILGIERAIVTDIAGTTRDILSAKYNYNGLSFDLFDTAGLRESSDIIEQIGIDKAKSLINKADILVGVFDSSHPLDDEDFQIINTLKGKNSLIVINKTDVKSTNFDAFEISSHFDNIQVLELSAKTSFGIDKLKQALFDKSNISNLLTTESVILTNERHFIALREALCKLEYSLTNLENLPTDCLILDIRQAWSLYGEVTGTTASEHIIDTIFSKLCLGK